MSALPPKADIMTAQVLTSAFDPQETLTISLNLTVMVCFIGYRFFKGINVVVILAIDDVHGFTTVARGQEVCRSGWYSVLWMRCV